MLPTSIFYPVQNIDVPVFRLDLVEYALFYAPGYLVKVNKDTISSFNESLTHSGGGQWDAGIELYQHAQAAQRIWDSFQEHPFVPVCLTLYLNNECNLDCSYCFSNPSSQPGSRLALNTIQAAAELIAKNCLSEECPFTVAFHGGGEPTLSNPMMKQVVDCLGKLTTENGLQIFHYLATNGVMSAATARRVAQRFDLIGLSCDGPASIQSCQRPLRIGNGSTSFIERTAQIINNTGTPLHIRVTVTNQTLERQTEIAEYICQELSPAEIHVEPVYLGGKAKKEIAIETERVDDYIAEFIKARNVARSYGIPWKSSGSRPAEIHGPYCNVFRGVLNLVPGGVATACFKTVTIGQARAHSLAIGAMDPVSGCFSLDHKRIPSMRQALHHPPAKCTGCFNRYHCARDCPDSCPLNSTLPVSNFRCRVQQKLTMIRLLEMATEMRTSGNGITGKKVN